jgi:hypothetical protein
MTFVYHNFKFVSILHSAFQLIFSLSNKIWTVFKKLSYACTKYSQTEHLSVGENIVVFEVCPEASTSSLPVILEMILGIFS